MTPEEREARRLAEEEQLRAYEEARARRRMQISDQFDQAYTTYTTTSWTDTGVSVIDRYRIDYDSFFTIREPDSPPPPPTLNEQLLEAQRQASQCAQRGDAHGQLMAIQEARRLRTRIQLINQVPSITV